MTKQRIAAVLWFFTGWMIGGMAIVLADLPAWTGLACALAFGTATFIDPLGVFQAKRAFDGPLRGPQGNLSREARKANPANTPRLS